MGQYTLNQKMLGKEERVSYRKTEQIATFFALSLCCKRFQVSMFPVRPADLKPTLKYYLVPTVFRFYFHFRVLHHFPGEADTENVSPLSFGFSGPYGTQSI